MTNTSSIGLPRLPNTTAFLSVVRVEATLILKFKSVGGTSEMSFHWYHNTSHHIMTTSTSFSSSFINCSSNNQEERIMDEMVGGGEGRDIDVRRDELQAKREACMTDIKRQLEASLDDMKETTKRLLTEIGHHVKVTHDVIYDYENVLETQQKEAIRLEEVSKTVNSATNPFLDNVIGPLQQAT